MAETIDELIARLPSGDELMKRVIHQMRRNKPFPKSRARKPYPLWSRVSEATTHGSGYSMAICVKYGFDPHETWIGERW